MSATVFEVEQAGCPSCAAVVRDALEGIATVLDVAVDESADLATVQLAADASLSEGLVDEVLRGASPLVTRTASGPVPGARRSVAGSGARVESALDGELARCEPARGPLQMLLRQRERGRPALEPAVDGP